LFIHSPGIVSHFFKSIDVVSAGQMSFCFIDQQMFCRVKDAGEIETPLFLMIEIEQKN